MSYSQSLIASTLGDVHSSVPVLIATPDCRAPKFISAALKVS
jgi:hypothetical protein